MTRAFLFLRGRREGGGSPVLPSPYTGGLDETGECSRSLRAGRYGLCVQVEGVNINSAMGWIPYLFKKLLLFKLGSGKFQRVPELNILTGRPRESWQV